MNSVCGTSRQFHRDAEFNRNPDIADIDRAPTNQARLMRVFASSGSSGSRGPVQHDLAGIAALHGVKSTLKVLDSESVRDDLAHLQTALQHRQHLVPGLEH